MTRTLLAAALMLASATAMGQAPASEGPDDQAAAARARRNAESFERNARVLTVYDRNGVFVTTVGERGIYNDPVFSPDGTKLAVIRTDFDAETDDLWVFDVATGGVTAITSHGSWDEEWAGRPVWSPNGRELAYVALRDGYEGVYRKASNGEGAEELVYRHAGAQLMLGDWSIDGRYLSLSASDFFGGTLYALPMGGAGERAPIEVFHSEAELSAGSFSPDARYVSYTSDETGKNEVYVRRFDPAAGAAAASADVQQISAQTGEFSVHSGWRQDGSELYFVAANGAIMAAEVDARATFGLGELTQLFRPSQAIRLAPGRINVSRDGERIVIAVPHAPKLEQVTVLDRHGTVLQRVGEPGIYRNPTLSPDGNRVAMMRIVPETGNQDIWTFDLTTGAGTPVTNDTYFDNWPVWSPDGRELAYMSRRDLYSDIYRKAWDGTGSGALVFQFTPGAFLQLTDWSTDGRFLTFHDGCWGVLHVLPLNGAQEPGERRAMDWLRDEYQVALARFSPDSRFIAYLSDEAVPDEFQLYVAPFDADQPEGGRQTAPTVQVSGDDVLGAISWRQDGKELYYLNADWDVMAVDVTTTPTFSAATPELLFTLPGPLPGNPKQWKSVSPDGQRFAFVLNIPVSAH